MTSARLKLVSFKLRPAEWFFCIGIVAGLVMLSYIVVVAKSESGMCYRNPLVYASQKLSEANGAHFYGIGYFDRPGIAIVDFNASGVYLRKPEQTGSPATNFNLSIVQGALQ